MAKVGVIGLGYVGLPLAVEIGRSGLEAIGIDVDARKVQSLNAGDSYISDVKSEELRPVVRSGAVRATTDFGVLAQCDAAIICVPTPLSKTREPDISYIVRAVEEIVPNLHKGMIVVLESTTYPGTTDEVVMPRIEATGLKVGQDIFLAFSPERVDPGNPFWKTKNTPKIVGGVTPACTDAAVALYSRVFDKVIPVSSSRCAEMVKLLENSFRAINIGMVNEMALMCDKLKLDVWEVIDAAATKPFGFMKFYPGPGIGGHCIPIDPHYLSWKLRSLNYTARFIELASAINTQMPAYLVSKVTDALNDVRKPVRGSRIFVLGVTYKKDVSDIRESPVLDVLKLLYEKGAELSFHDPYVPGIDEFGLKLQSVDLTDEALAKADCVVIGRDHGAFDYARICRLAPLIVDAHNVTKGCKATGRIVKI
jgi:UDP-N-acetyl-D-glucosamine dehydrogenase